MTNAPGADLTPETIALYTQQERREIVRTRIGTVIGSLVTITLIGLGIMVLL